MTQSTLLQIRREGAIDHVVLNRPEVRNAFNEDLIAQLGAWAERAEHDVELRAAVLSGAGKMFCAGGDLEWMTKMAGYSQQENLRDATAAARTFLALDTLRIPL